MSESLFYAEWIHFDDEKELEEAHLYLSLWKKNLLRKLKGYKQKGHDQIIIKPASLTSPECTIGIKIQVVKNE